MANWTTANSLFTQAIEERKLLHTCVDASVGLQNHYDWVLPILNIAILKLRGHCNRSSDMYWCISYNIVGSMCRSG